MRELILPSPPAELVHAPTHMPVPQAGAVLSTLGKMGRLSGVTKSPEFVRQFTKFWLPMGKDVVVIGGSLVGLELAEFLADRGRRVTLLHEKQQLGLPLATPRRWTAIKDATYHGVKIHRSSTVTRITEKSVEWTVGGEDGLLRTAAIVVYADGTMSAAPLAVSCGTPAFPATSSVTPGQ